MLFLSNEHAKRWLESVTVVDAVDSKGMVSSYFAASLYLLTADDDIYLKAKGHFYYKVIDFKSMLGNDLSSGARLIVSLAGELYNGCFFDSYRPSDISCKLDVCWNSL